MKKKKKKKSSNFLLLDNPAVANKLPEEMKRKSDAPLE